MFQNRRKNEGLTVAEALVSCALLMLLSAMFAATFNQTRTSSEGGGKRLELRGIHRETQQKLTVLVRSAMAPNEADPAIVAPLYGDSGTGLIFHAPANLLDPTQPFDPRVPNYPEFTLELESTKGTLVIQRSDLSGPKRQLGRGFSSLEIERRDKHALFINLTSRTTVRGASSGPKEVEETSRNLIRLPGIR